MGQKGTEGEAKKEGEVARVGLSERVVAQEEQKKAKRANKRAQEEREEKQG